jgi:hypothetical protein
MSSSSSSDLRHERHTWMEQHLFPNRDGVGYGLSSYNVPIVTDDPYRYSLSRVVCVYAAIVILMIYFVTKLRGLYELVKAHAPTNVCLLRAVVLVAVSVVVSGVHHYDNFWHVEEYHLASWIYNGYFFIFDFGVMNWIVAAIFAVFGLQTLIKCCRTHEFRRRKHTRRCMSPPCRSFDSYPTPAVPTWPQWM